MPSQFEQGFSNGLRMNQFMKIVKNKYFIDILCTIHKITMNNTFPIILLNIPQPHLIGQSA
ncbi:hypothetical protein Pgin03_01546 [Porphyromonas gingivalis]